MNKFKKFLFSLFLLGLPIMSFAGGMKGMPSLEEIILFLFIVIFLIANYPFCFYLARRAKKNRSQGQAILAASLGMVYVALWVLFFLTFRSEGLSGESSSVFAFMLLIAFAPLVYTWSACVSVFTKEKIKMDSNEKV